MKNFYIKSKTIKIIILISLCLISFIVFISTFKQLYKENDLGVNYNFKNEQNHFSRTIKAKNASLWMTFDYINVVFRLDPDYLKQSLSIDDAKYPNIRVGHYIKYNNLNSNEFLNNLNTTINNYPNNQ